MSSKWEQDRQKKRKDDKEKGALLTEPKAPPEPASLSARLLLADLHTDQNIAPTVGGGGGVSRSAASELPSSSPPTPSEGLLWTPSDTVRSILGRDLIFGELY
jgi:hypothetical protein